MLDDGCGNDNYPREKAASPVQKMRDLTLLELDDDGDGVISLDEMQRHSAPKAPPGANLTVVSTQQARRGSAAEPSRRRRGGILLYFKPYFTIKKGY